MRVMAEVKRHRAVGTSLAPGSRMANADGCGARQRSRAAVGARIGRADNGVQVEAVAHPLRQQKREGRGKQSDGAVAHGQREK